jgi:hypothetical protein
MTRGINGINQSAGSAHNSDGDQAALARVRDDGLSQVRLCRM